MSLTKEERILNLFEGKSVDYLPSQITFADRTRDKEISRALGLDSVEQLDDYLENHIYFTYCKDDIPLFFRNDMETMEQLEHEGFAHVSHEDSTVYDRWGMGILIGEDGFFTNYGALGEDVKLNARARDYLPDSITRLWDMPFEKAVEAYEAPDPLAEGSFEWYERDIKNHSGDFCVVPSGYFGIYERAYALVGWERFMTEIAGNKKLMMGLMEKITDYRMKLAKVKADMGFKLVHHGDDLGMQFSGFFSPEMFREMILPHYKRLFGEYKKNGQYIMMHSCGNIMSYLPMLIDAGLDALEPVQPCNGLREIKREFGNDLVFMGGIDTQALPYMPQDEVRVMTREAIEILGKGGRYIIAPSQEIMNDVPLENVIAILETAVEMRDKVM